MAPNSNPNILKHTDYDSECLSLYLPGQTAILCYNLHSNTSQNISSVGLRRIFSLLLNTKWVPKLPEH